MKYSQIKTLVTAAKNRHFVSFEYTKEGGETSTRVVRFGGDLVKKLNPSGEGSWMTGHGQGFRSMIVVRNGKTYVRGTDTKDGKHKIFKLEGIANVKYGKE